MLENGRAHARNPDFNPMPIVVLLDPNGGGKSLLTDLDRDDDDIAPGLCDLGFGLPELGSVRVSELEVMHHVHRRLGIGIERHLNLRLNMTIGEYANEALRRRRRFRASTKPATSTKSS